MTCRVGSLNGYSRLGACLAKILVDRLVTTLLAVGVAAIVTIRTPAQYASTVTFFVRTPADQTRRRLSRRPVCAKSGELLRPTPWSREIAKLVLNTTKADLSPEEVQSAIVAKADLNTVMLTATVTDESPERSLALAQAVSKIS